ncbi:MAG: LysR family transcriptional regulator [Pseudorhodobacter sp. PARRP1]|nr:MAG: LysR family transcriptional regulator [Pseudorhodobacter sp. PARRP1]
MIEKSDNKSLDSRTLQLFLLVLQTGSFTKAADMMHMNQSAVSYALDRLRLILNDPLFVKSGRSISPTPRAIELESQAKHLLAEMNSFMQPNHYDPLQDAGEFVIAANDYEVEVLLNPFARILQNAAPQARLRLIQPRSHREWAQLLRESVVDLVLAPPLVTNETDLAQKTVFRDSHLCYFDPQMREAPLTLDAYCMARHIVMALDRSVVGEVDTVLAPIGKTRQIAVFVPSFTSFPLIMRGTDLVATLPKMMRENILKGFASCPLPLDMPDFPIAQIWHARNTNALRHRWLRDQIDKVLKT